MVSPKIRKSIYLLCMCIFIAFGFSCASPLEQSRKRFTGEPTREIYHPTGMFLRLPESLEARVKSDGFHITPRDSSPRDTRYPVGATIRFHPNETQPKGEWRRKESIGARVIWYRITDSEVIGSGGTEYEINAWELYPDGYIAYQQRDQKEVGEPDFSICWVIIDGLSFQNQ